MIAFLFTCVSVLATDDAAFTSHDIFSRAAFPQHEMVAKYQNPSPAEDKRISQAKELVAGQLRALPHEWSKPIIGRALSVGERERLLDRFAKSPLFFCRGEKCGGCREKDGCMLFKKSAGVLATALVLGPQFRNSRAPEELMPVLFWSIAELLHALSDGDTWMSREKRESVKAAVLALVDTANKRLRMRERCPGPFLDSDRSFLESNGVLNPLNEFWEQCGAELLAPVRRLETVPECARLIDLKRWAKNRKEGWFSGAVVFRRCEDACELATCGNPATPVARFIPFRSSAVVSLPSQACEGSRANDASRLVRQVVASYLHPEIRRSPTSATEVKLCIAKLVPSARDPERIESVVEPAPVIELNLVE